MGMAKTWDSSENWYSSCVGEKGHYYHQSVVLPGALRLLAMKKGSLLDLGCGQGVLARHLPKGIEYCGVDSSKALIASAKKMTEGQFHVADATRELPIEKTDFDRATFILSLQNMEDMFGAVKVACHHLKKGGRLLMVLNHPCFRIPRQSSWGIDESAKLQYRRINSYMSVQKIPLQTNPSKGEKSEVIYSYHHPLSDYMKALGTCSIVAMEEWCSDKKSEGSKARMEDRARREIPLFLAILAEKK